MKFKRNPSAYPVVLVLFLLTLTSCNRGYGCPYDFSLDTVVANTASVVLKFISLIF
ncbi:MAG: hypothetical protein KA251_06525 [Saprospiraceae bacterium]|nr:hypothetical protein [Candidatus Vicinibacter affinis]MBP6172271.1 hypothetical protein [Saprospiraceae bacterium]MBK6572032.1 hypothetical protein [Candidatus Vicinibacter affinis]MBK6823968.1 hypothetical protein [Candidatus Vicinibacter affinis]MBK7305182.1 hypothetical protein [Candidatus Vicinibacter affinis]